MFSKENDKKDGLNKIITIELALLVSLVPLLPSTLRPQYYLTLRTLASEIIVAVLGLTLIYGWAAGKIKGKLCAGHILMIAFIVSGAISISYCIDRVTALQSLHLHFCWLIVTFAGYYLFRDKKTFLNCLKWIAPGAVIICAYGIWEKFSTGASQISSTMGFPTLYGGYLLCALFLFQCGMITAQKKNERIIFAFTLCLLVINLCYCGSLAAWFSFITGEGLLLMNYFSEFWKKKNINRTYRIKTIFIISFLLITILVLFTQNNLKRDITSKKESLQMRLDRWEIAWNMVWEKPLLGFGSGQYEVYFPHYRAKAGAANETWERDIDIEVPVNTENIALMLLAEQGVFAFLIFAGIFIWTLYIVFSRSASAAPWKHQTGIHLGCGIIAILGYSIFHFPFHTPGVWGIIWTMVSIIWAVLQINGKAETSEEHKIKSVGNKSLLLMPFLIPAALLFIYLLYLPFGYWTNDIQFKKGEVYAINGDIEKFRRAFEKTYPFVPRTWRYYYYYGEGLLRSGEEEEAIVKFKVAEKFRPYSIIILRKIQQALFFSKQTNTEEFRLYKKRIKDLTDANQRI
ncbi:MAG: O-antigen ligase [bacterium]